MYDVICIGLPLLGMREAPVKLCLSDDFDRVWHQRNSLIYLLTSETPRSGVNTAVSREL